MRNRILVLLLTVLACACVTTPATNNVDFTSLRSEEVLGLKMKLPRSMKRFNEDGFVAFRPDPPTRTSPGILVLRQNGDRVEAQLRAIYIKVEEQMSGEPIFVHTQVGQRTVRGVYAELVTHFVWMYIFTQGNATYTLQIVAPLDWTDEDALSFHDIICQNVTLEKESER